MKIIGRGAGTNFIVQMGEDELANLNGKHSAYRMDFKVGQEFSVSSMFQEADKTLRLYRELSGNLEKLQEHLSLFNGLLSKRQPQEDEN